MKFREWFSIIKENKKKIIMSLFFLAVAILMFFAAGDYLTDHSQNYATAPDLILDHFGPYNLNFIFVWLFLAIITIFFLYPLIFKPEKIAYTINMFSLLVVVRSIFIMFTHLRIPYDAIQTHFPSFLQLLNFQNDLFFSGHVGISFLGFLIFYKDNKILSYFMLLASAVLGATVLLMHVHYSIDVFSAFFITYGVYKIGEIFARK